MAAPFPCALAGKLAFAAVLFLAVPALAQPSPAAGGASQPAWTFAAGIESFWLRDVASTGPPVEASPVAWEGMGPVVYVAYDRDAPTRLHHVEGSWATNRGFELRSPVLSRPAPDEDRASRLSGRYEYRRYPFRDLWFAGFDLGVGVEGSADYLAFQRHFAPDIELRKGLTNFGVAGVVTARLRRWSPWSVLTVWGNGLAIGRATSRHEAGADLVETNGWGGGWQTNLLVHAAVRLAARTSLYGAYLTSGEGRAASHDTSTFGRSRFMIGVSHDR